jgi:PglZ domain
VAGAGVTGTATRATLPVLRALLDQARHKNYASGVLGVRARPEWPGSPTFTHENVPVRVVPCVSALAVREALLDRERGQWLVVLTDRADDDLGSGVLSHLVWNRLRTPDPWDAVRLRFAATGVEPALTATAEDRGIATGLLMAAPPSGWQPAPGGVLTRDHAFGAVAAIHLGLTDPVVDATSVLAWTTDPALVTRVADLRALAGDALTSAVLEWIAERAGPAGRPLLPLLRAGEARDAVPLGLVAGLLADAQDSAAAGQAAGASTHGSVNAAQIAREALIRLEPRLGGTTPHAATLWSWARESSALLAGMLRDPVQRGHGMALLGQADELLAGTHAIGLADGSDLLPAGLTRRLASLAGALPSALAVAQAQPPASPDAPQIPVAELAEVEHAWVGVAAHQLAGTDPRVPAFHAAVRLARWLATDASASGTSLPALLGRHADSDAWVDSAVNDAAPGTSDPDLGAGLAAVLAATRTRRAAHDLTFGAALAVHTGSDAGDRHDMLQYLEDLLPEVVLPLARATPILLLVLDGMSAGVGTEIIDSVLSLAGEGWAEALLPGHTRRAAALAVLPTLTEVSRASLLCGDLRVGGQDVEQNGYQTLTKAHGLGDAVLFHKKPLDSSRPGYAVADDVAAAIADVTGYPLVTCVLNTIDDALDRSDPGGTAWSTDAVKHLAPLLERGQHAGRVAILTADHGHIVERRQGIQRSYPTISSGRSRAATESAGDGEVLVTGRRVLLHDGRAVLAVDEHLRYGPLKAGYHGGGAPAEAVVPVAVLVPGAVPDGADLALAPPQQPTWWIDPAESARRPAAPPATDLTLGPAPTAGPRSREQDQLPTLFDEPELSPARAGSAAASPVPAGPASQGSPVTTAVLKSAVYAAQKKIAGRVSVRDDQIRELLDTLLLAAGRRLAPSLAATALAVSPVMLRGAVLHAQRLLNVEGYPVLRVDADGATVILDEALLREQFGIRP